MELARIYTQSKFFFEGNRKFWIQGVSYGPFQPRDPQGSPFPTPQEVQRDFTLMREAGINTVRLYEIPPLWFVEQASQVGLRLFLTLPWTQRVRFLEDRRLVQDIRRRLATVVRTFRGHPAVAGYFIDNELPADLCRWYGPKRIEAFLDSLVQTVKEIDPGALTSYANFPPTEYLLPGSVDFYSYNVYLHERKALGNYLARLQNLVGEKPLVLSEFGMDTQRHSEEAQAVYLREQWEEILSRGLAGGIVFCWTDEWYTDGVAIKDWSFGIVREDRSPKKGYSVLQELWARSPQALWQRFPLRPFPRVTVAICTYNGAATLAECLRSVSCLSYPDYEVIVVDDGSTDATQAILAQFPSIRNIRQANLGLSAARNRAIGEASGEIIAFTDSDCMADPDWLYYLVTTLLQGPFAGVGGPNLSPPARTWVEATVGKAPGSPSHVLISDQEAEHVPGCNMAFFKKVLLELGGWDPQFRIAGDDVDLCWRLREKGYRIGFAPAAIVWHHRRCTVGAYLRQQKGYGQAEALLRFKHLHYFGPTGSALWKGRVYTQVRLFPLWKRPTIYHGVFGSGFFQLLYPPQESGWGNLFGSFEWIFFGLVILLCSTVWPELRIVPPFLFAPTLLWALGYMSRADLEECFDGIHCRLLLFLLVLLQPVVRGWARYRTWFQGKRTPRSVLRVHHEPKDLGKGPTKELSFWSEKGIDRITLLSHLEDRLRKEGWSYCLDTGWTHWDIHIFASRWWGLRIRTLTEIYPHGKRLTRVANELVPSPLCWILALGSCFGLGALAASQGTLPWPLGWGVALGLLLSLWYLHGNSVRSRVADLIRQAARDCGLTPVQPPVGQTRSR
ncbi:glycosyltransferase [Candidatus Methylacidithermus pantelleriae]|uniref:Glycosyltransferase, GT2 family n=1 Tax=Candidatus Methylacidithermus pantelleriae TaxID=2744239 RepID=A0A8J2FSG8_9BACT|nr:glycosyltransferase [Candidatus Methylacidithermus pantelleriae]CAF0696179.1 Glycosyltransferase, GT2 family [Candidatus Methylacidithermus pantelleriae]